DLIADYESEYRRMISTCPHTGAHAALDVTRQLPTVGEGDVLLPGKADHEAQTVLRGKVKKPPRRHRVETHRVSTCRRDAREVLSDAVGVRVDFTFRIWAEGPVGHTTDIQFLVPDKEELTVGLAPRRGTWSDRVKRARLDGIPTDQADWLGDLQRRTVAH